MQHGASSGIAFLRGPKAESLPRSVVELRRNHVAVLLGQGSHAAPFREVLPQQAVGVLVGPAFPGVETFDEAIELNPCLERGAVELRIIAEMKKNA